MAKLTLTNITDTRQSSAATTINANSDLVEAAVENTLSRDGTSPNQMEADLDMNSNRVLNLIDATTGQEPVTLSQMQGTITAISSEEIALLVDKGTVTSGTVTFNRNDSSKQKLTVGGNLTVAVTGFPVSGIYSELEIQLVNGGAFTVTWPAVTWMKGDGTSDPSFSSMGVTLQNPGTNFVLIWTSNGGATLYGKAI